MALKMWQSDRRFEVAIIEYVHEILLPRVELKFTQTHKAAASLRLTLTSRDFDV